MSHVCRRTLSRLTTTLHGSLRGTRFEVEFARLRELERSPRTGVEAWQRERLRAALDLWARRIPFYRDHLGREAAARGLPLERLLDDLAQRGDLSPLPLMDKAAVRAAGASLEVEGADRRRLVRNHTGGSTGEVFHFLQNGVDERWLQAGVRLFREMLGLDAHCRTAQIWGASIEASSAATARARAVRWLLHTQFHSTYDLTRERRREIVRAIHAFGPELLVGYPSSLSSFLPDVRELGRAPFPALRAIWSASETLLHGLREELQEAFGAPVYNNYGCREFGPLAMECPAREGLHLNEGAYWFEFLPVAEGLREIVVTDLKNEVMPLVRYRMGDLAQGDPGLCSCGRGFRILRGLEGRTFDLVRGRDGEVVTGTFWTLLLRTRPGVQRFQVLQEDWDEFVIRLETTAGFQRESLDFFRDQIQGQFRRPVHLDFRLDEPIQVQASGKFRFIQSKVGATAPPPGSAP